MGWLWHRRLGHGGMKELNRLVKHDLVLDLKDVKFDKDKLCSACQAGKQVANPHPNKSIMSTTRPLELLRMYLFGPTTYRSIGGNTYCLVIVDDYSRYTWVLFLHDEHIACDIFKTFVRRTENEFEQKLKKVRSDNGIEFKNTNVEEFCDEKGIKHELLTTYTPEKNGVVERENRTLIEMARSILDEYKFSDSFWVEAINTTCHASNRLYCRRFFNKTSYELLNGRKPNIFYFHVFGCKCYILRKGSWLSKFQNKCDEGFVLGYSSNSKAYRVYSKSKRFVEEAYDVQFDETMGSQDEKENLDDVRGEELSKAMKTMAIGDIMPREEDDDEGPSISIQANPSTSTTNDQNQQEGNSSNNDSPQEDDQMASMTTPTSTQELVDQPKVHHQVAKDHPIDQIMGDISKGVQTRSRVASCCQHYSFVSFHEPKHVDEALDDPDWVIFMQEELNNFTGN
jgi:transposase InsO family protein